MTQAIHLLVCYKVSTECTLTHLLLTYLILSTTLWATRVHHLMTLDYSTVLTFLYRWFVRLVRIHSNQKLDSRPDMVLLPTHLLKEQIKVLVESRQIVTDTIRELQLQTLCNKILHILKEIPSGVSFFMCFKSINI